MTVAAIAIAGALGALCRVGIYNIAGPQRWPWTTLIINVVGSFLLGLLMTLVAEHVPTQYRSAITAGFLGAFTTYSTFAYEITDMLDGDRLPAAAAYVAASIALGVVAVFCGISLAERLQS